MGNSINDFSDIPEDLAKIAEAKLVYDALMGRKTNVTPQLLSFSPESYIPIPDEEDYQRGIFPRFFARKANDPNATVTEVSQEAYTGPVKNSPFYTGVVIKWRISGSLEDVYSDDGILQEKGIIDYNKNQITQAERQGGVKLKIHNHLEFYKPS